jgi:soluble lytic murein transglycosylase-like protein
MSNVQKAIFPGFIAGAVAMVLAVQLIASPTLTVQAAPAQSTPAAAAVSSSGCGVSPRFPEKVQRWCQFITQYAAQNDLDPNLVAAVILQESGGDPQAYSSSGAVGLMQVMPSDGAAAQFMCSGRPCFQNRPSIQELSDPEFNISYGTRMLSALIRKYGNIRDGLKAYGPMDRGYEYADIVLTIQNNYR